MKNLGLLILISLISSVVSVALYRYFEEPREVLYRPISPALQANYSSTDETLSASKPRQFISSSPTNFISAAAIVTPAVVNIRATQANEYDFFGGSYGGSSGSGVIISPDGYIVTNNHVIEDGKIIKVTLNDKRKYEAEVIGTDPNTDLALLKVKASNLPSLVFGDSDSIQVGEWVLAVGNPFDLESTVTAGIISAKGRNINILEGSASIESFIQTDAAVNPGNSGGALVNTNGELIGINTAIITKSGKYEGYSFAIPANLSKKIIRDLKDFGIVQRGFLGVQIDDVNDEMAKELDLKLVEGVVLTQVNPRSGAEDAGLRRKDVLIQINNIKIKTVPELQEQVALYRPGNKVKVHYIRNGKKYKTDVILKNGNNSTSIVDVKDNSEEAILSNLGFALRDLRSGEKRRLKVEGAYVKSITRGSKIERTNMDPGFIITKVNNKEIGNVQEIINLLKKVEGKVMLEGIYEGYEGEYGYTFTKEK